MAYSRVTSYSTASPSCMLSSTRRVVLMGYSRPAMVTVSTAPWLRRMVSTSAMREATEGLFVSIMRRTSRVLV